MCSLKSYALVNNKTSAWLLRSGLTHHLESIELIRHCLDLLFLARLLDFDAGCIPVLRLGSRRVSGMVNCYTI